MNRLPLSLIAALAVAGTACERHPASELEGAHGKQHAPAEAQAANKHEGSTPLTPPHTQANPAGANPVDHRAPADPEPKKSPAAANEAPKFFPDGK